VAASDPLWRLCWCVIFAMRSGGYDDGDGEGVFLQYTKTGLIATLKNWCSVLIVFINCT
jgi:hypothetical protein